MNSPEQTVSVRINESFLSARSLLESATRMLSSQPNSPNVSVDKSKSRTRRRDEKIRKSVFYRA